MSMKLNSKHSYKLSVKRATRRVRKQQPQQQQHQQQHQRRKRTTICKATHASSKLSQKLQALKNLISPHNNDEDIVKPDVLFQETADYIVLLRTRVVILQKLIEFYDGSHIPENGNALLL